MTMPKTTKNIPLTTDMTPVYRQTRLRLGKELFHYYRSREQWCSSPEIERQQGYPVGKRPGRTRIHEHRAKRRPDAWRPTRRKRRCDQR